MNESLQMCIPCELLFFVFAQINTCNAYTMCGIEKSRMNAFDEQNDCICEYGNGRFVRFQNSSQPTRLVDNSNILIK